MLDFDVARRTLLETVSPEGDMAPPLGRERVSVWQASGRVLAEDVRAPVPVPRSDYSAMDGYALLAKDLETQDEFPVIGECQTGHPSVAVQPKSCVRIFTGAAIPPGADAVVMQENVERRGDLAKIGKAPVAGENIRRAGEDLGAGDIALSAGSRLSGFQLGILAVVERVEVLVARKPRVMIVCTGDELRAPGQPGGDGLAESNSVALAALVESVGGIAVRAPLTGDSLEETKASLASAAAGADVVLTVGGVSVGDHDVVRPALEQLGAESFFWKVKMKPGKPVLLSKLGRTWFLGLPGNPSSAQVCFALFGMPLLRALQGDAEPVAAVRRARLRGELKQKTGRRGFYRARLSGDEVEVHPNQASGASTAMAWANCLIVLPEDVTGASSGQEVQVVAYADL